MLTWGISKIITSSESFHEQKRTPTQEKMRSIIKNFPSIANQTNIFTLGIKHNVTDTDVQICMQAGVASTLEGKKQ